MEFIPILNCWPGKKALNSRPSATKSHRANRLGGALQESGSQNSRRINGAFIRQGEEESLAKSCPVYCELVLVNPVVEVELVDCAFCCWRVVKAFTVVLLLFWTDVLEVNMPCRIVFTESESA